MANTRSNNVIVVDTSAQFSENLTICSIKYIGAASGTASIKADSTSGVVVWEESGTANVYNAEVEIQAHQGMYVTVTNSAKLYIYFE
jgi:hypothetical protein